MASLIAAVRNARYEDREFEGVLSPRMHTAMLQSLILAEQLVFEAGATRELDRREEEARWDA